MEVIFADNDFNETSSSSKKIIYLIKPTKLNLSNFEVDIESYIEENSHRLRDRYYQWIDETISLKDRRNISIKERLYFKKIPHLLFQNRIFENSNFSKSKYIDDVIKVFAIEDILKDLQISKIIFLSESSNIFKCINNYCKSKNIEFILNSKIKKTKPMNSILRNIYLKLPLPIAAFLGFIYRISIFYKLKGVGVKDWKNHNSKNLFSGYLGRIKKNNNSFQTEYWGNLPSTLQSENINSCWLHLWASDKTLKDISDVKKLINDLNSNQSSLDRHTTFYSFISIKIIFVSIFNWIKVLSKIPCIKEALQTRDRTGMDIWQLHEKDFYESLIGEEGLFNILFSFLCNEALAHKNGQHSLIYAQENQPWEVALNSYSRKYNFLNTFGSPNTLIRYWDLRYLRTKNFPKKYSPDFITSNGKNMKNSLILNYQDPKKIKEVEALRYQYLRDIEGSKIKEKVNVKGPLKILAIGEYNKENTAEMLKVLNEIDHEQNKIKIFYKPHPLCNIRIEDYKNISISNESNLVKALDDIDLAIISPQTTASVEVEYIGIPTITFLNGRSLNQSPLRGVKNYPFVFSAQQINIILENPNILKSSQSANFFYLDEKNLRWLDILR